MSASENIRTIKIYALYLLLFLGYLFSQGLTILIICTHVLMRFLNTSNVSAD